MEVQYLRNSYYTVWLVGPDGAREAIGYTQRKTGAGAAGRSSAAHKAWATRRARLAKLEVACG